MKNTAVILGTFAFGYVLAIVFRSVNAIIAPNLSADIGLGASDLGILTAALLIAHGLGQLPLGVALDRFGPRRVQATFFACATVGALAFGLGDDMVTLTAARALIGLGFAGALMGGFKAVVLFLPDRQALGNACIMAGGQTGLLIATWPAELMVSLVGWRAMFIGLSGVALAAAALFLVIVPESTAGRRQSLGQQLGGIAQVARDPVFWRIAPLVMVTGGTSIAFITLWVGPWFRDVAGLDRGGVATSLTITAAAVVTGVFLAGWSADRLGRHGIGLLTVMSGCLVMFMAAQVPIMLGSQTLMYPAWIVFAMTGQTSILAYPWLAMYFGAGLSARANTTVNLALFVFAFLAQAGVGAVIDLYPPTAEGGYDPRGYFTSLAVLLALQIAAFAWFAAGRRGLDEFPGRGR